MQRTANLAQAGDSLLEELLGNFAAFQANQPPVEADEYSEEGVEAVEYSEEGEEVNNLEAHPLGVGEYPRLLPVATYDGVVRIGFLASSDSNNVTQTLVTTDATVLEQDENSSVRRWTPLPLGPELLALITEVVAAGAPTDANGVLIGDHWNIPEDDDGGDDVEAGAEALFEDAEGEEVVAALAERPGHRAGRIATTPAIRELAAAITGENDGWWHQQLIVVEIPAAARFTRAGAPPPAEEGGQTERIATLLGTFEPVPDRPHQVLNPNTGRPLGNPRTIFQILRQYRLSGDALKLPYAAIDTNNPVDGGEPNCLRRYLIDRYHTRVTNVKRKLSAKLINRLLDASAIDGVPTAEGLLAFGKARNIEVTLYDVLGRRIYASPAPEKPRDRPPVVAMLYGNHIYPYTGGGQGKSKVDLGYNGDTELPDYANPARIHSEADAADGRVFNKFMSAGVTPNFFYASEQPLISQSLSWYIDQVAPPAAGAVCWDMKKAFDTAIHRLTSSAQKIPIFTVHDTIEPYDPSTDGIHDHCYYFVSEACLARWVGGHPAVAARMNNLLHGFEYKTLEIHGLVSKGDITHVKAPSYTMTTAQFRENILDSCIDAKGLPAAAKLRGKAFALYNGMLGRRQTKNVHVSFGGISEEDIELLSAGREPEDVRVSRADGHEPSIRVRTVASKILYINTSNLYNFTVARTADAVTKYILSALARNPRAKVLKIKTDGVVFDRAIDNFQVAYSEHFVREPVKWRQVTYRPAYLDPVAIREKTIAEIAVVRDRTRVVVGPPGSGKTHLIKFGSGDIDAEKYDKACTTTNTCARNLDTDRVLGETIYVALGLHTPENALRVANQLKDKCLWLDEFSMVSRYIWSYIFIATTQTRLTILSGDPNQVPPVGEDLAYGSTFLRELFSAKEILHKDYRNDKRIIELRDRIQAQHPESTYGMLAEMYDELGLQSGERVSAYRTHLVRTHPLRRRINSVVASELGLAWTHEARDVKNPSKGFFHMADPGLRLVARITRKNLRVYKGCRYTLQTIVDHATPDFVVHRDGDPEDAAFTLPIESLRLFGLGYAMTVQSAQGLTIRDPFVVWDIERGLIDPEFGDPRLLYTAVTRGVRYEDLRIVLDKTHDCIKAGDAADELLIAETADIPLHLLGVDEDAFKDCWTYEG